MTAQWVKYGGSDEQIANIEKALEGYVLRLEAVSGTHQTELLYRDEWDKFGSERIIEYLICAPHPYADMICQWARTGQPVWWRSITGGGTGLCHENFPPFMHPGEFEYSFTPFEEEV